MLKICAGIIVIVGVLLSLSNYKLLRCDIECEDILKQATLELTDLIALSGYPAEQHTVKTKDGYKLIAHRIPYGKKVPAKGGIPVLLMHGLMGNSGGWINNLNESLGFILADEGFDVWMGNVRGNENSGHEIYTRDEPEFWDYSFEDMAECDLPALIDYILNITKYKKILYVGYSQGSTMAFILFSNPEFNDKVAGFVALAPVLTYGHLSDFVLSNLVNHIGRLQPYLKMSGISQFKVYPDWFKKYVPMVCAHTPVCEFFATLTTGFGDYFYNVSRVPIYTVHATEGTTVKNFMHMRQSGPYLAKFDYGKRENINRYGIVSPPEYNISNIVIPISIFSSANDPLATPLLIAKTKRRLKSVIAQEIISEPMFSHINFYASLSMRSLLADKMLLNMRYMWSRNGSI